MTTKGSEVSVEELMHEIRRAVVHGRQIIHPPEHHPADETIQTPTEGVELQALFLQPEFHPKATDHYHVNDFLQFHGSDFVRNAYRAILRREPDAGGLTHHLENLASGRVNKIDVLASLRFSAEGEIESVQIDGLRWPVAIRRLGRVPLIGYVVQLLVAFIRLPRLLQHQRQAEFYFSAQQQRLLDHHNQMAESVTQVIAKAKAEAEKVEALSHEQKKAANLQGELNAEFEERLRVAQERLEQSWARLDHLVQMAAQYEKNTAALVARVDQQETRTSQTEQGLADIVYKQQHTHSEVMMQMRRASALLEKTSADGSPASTVAFAEQTLKEEAHYLDALYASFEDQFRGEPDDIKNRLRVYLPIFQDEDVKEGTLDIGCGRGEWLELLKEAGITARGVDHNRIFVAQCRDAGLDVTEDDALNFLHGLPDESLNAITSFHTVEHLPFEIMVKWLDETHRLLKPRGFLILETPNPENFMVGSCNFYADPTHRNPIPSATLKFMLEARGFARTRVMKLRPWDAAKIEGDSEIIKRFNEYFYSAPDYGIVAWKI
jgi:O-antigen chain-terminating methyltransferase